LVFFDPINLEVSERFAVETSDDWKAMFIVQGRCKESFLDIDRTLHAPSRRYSGLIHPVMEKVRIAWMDVDVA